MRMVFGAETSTTSFLPLVQLWIDAGGPVMGTGWDQQFICEPGPALFL